MVRASGIHPEGPGFKPLSGHFYKINSNRPQQNGVAEWANRLFPERIVALLEESGMFKKYWAECLAALIYVLNHCPTSAVEGKTPHEV